MKNKNTKNMILSFLLLWLIFTLHHIYGEYFVYKDGLRLEAIIISIPIYLGTFLLFIIYEKNKNKYVMYIFKAVTFSIIIFIGFFEGLYNHTILNILKNTDIMLEASNNFFMKKPSNDIINEISGALEFVFVLPFIYFLYKYLKDKNTKKNKRENYL